MTNNSNRIRARNVVATLRGSEFPQEKIVIGVISIRGFGDGRIDNGIGSFSVLDIARAFKANVLLPKGLFNL